YPAWHAADEWHASGTTPLVDESDSPPILLAQGITWTKAGISMSASGYELKQVWPSSFGLPGQLALLPNGDVVLGDPSTNRIIQVSKDEAQVLASEVEGWYVTVLPDGRIVVLSQTGDLIAFDVSSGEQQILSKPPAGKRLKGPLAADASGNIYVSTHDIDLYRLSSDGQWSRLAANLPFPNPGFSPLTDMDVAEDGTVYVAGFTRVVAVRRNGTIDVVADGLNYEPVWVEIAPDGRVYINELTFNLQRYEPKTAWLSQVQVSSGFGDFLATSSNEFIFYDFRGILYYLNLKTDARRPLFVKTSGNSLAFAASADDAVYCTTPPLEPMLKSHIIRLRSDGMREDLHQLSYDDIIAADVDSANRLNLLTDKGIVRVEPNGSLTIIPLTLPRKVASWALRNLAAGPNGVWYITWSNFQDTIRLYRVDVFGIVTPLPISFDRQSFGGAYTVDDARVDVGPDGRLAIIATAKGSASQGPYYQRVFRANADGSGFVEIANLDSQRIAGMVDIAVGPEGNVFVLVVQGETGGPDPIFRIDLNGNVSKTVNIQAGRDPKSIDIDPSGAIWFGTTLGVFRAASTPTPQD
ncbi:MAG: hypothetical protein KAY24_18295, partial [Candidatus Eisenbacteria sp.]|nr:hypothetical protein [Candidatus Eisenbacteria bacterium]